MTGPQTRQTLHRLALALGKRERRQRGAGQPTVFISGAARGIGRATAELFASHGWLVGVADIDTDACSWAAGEAYVRIPLVVTDPDSWEQALRRFAAAGGGRLDVLVNNAGLLYAGGFEAGNFRTDQALVDVNVTGVLNGSRAGHELLAATPGAMLINLCSAAANYGIPDMATYSATKMAVRGISEALDQEWAEQDIAVRTIWPLYVPTRMIEGVETGGTRRLGVRLTAADVAARIYAVATSRNPLAGVHHPVGIQSTVMFHASHFAPSTVSRAVTHFLVGR